MAIVGSAYVEIRALTSRVQPDIERALAGSDRAFRAAGQNAGRAFNDGFSGSIDTSSLGENGRRGGRQFGEGVRNGIDEARSDIESAVERAGSGSGDGGIFSKLMYGKGGDAARSGTQLRASILVLDGLAGIIAPAIGALGSLASSLFAVGAAAVQASQSLIVLPASLGAIIQSAITLKVAFGGVGEALKAGMQQQQSAAGTAASTAAAQQAAARAVANATRSLKDAQTAAAEAAENAAERIKKAQDRVGDVIKSNARAAESAAEAVARAQERVVSAYETAAKNQTRDLKAVATAESNLTRAQQNALKAQQDLNKAREDAAESLQQLSFSLRDAQLSEEQATLDLADAREQAAQASYLPVNDRTRIDADLALKRAQLAYDQAKDRSQDLAKENDAANKAGIEGSNEVLSAKDKEAAANQSVLDAESALTEARQKAADDAVDAQKSIADAVRSLDRAYRDQQETATDGAEKLADAQKAVNDAVKQGEKDNASAARRIADAQQSVADAVAAAATAANGGAGAVDKFAQSMKNLSPEAAAFVTYMLSIQDVFKTLRAQAGVELFPKLQESLEGAINSGFFNVLGTGLQQTGSAIGDVALKFSGLLSNPFFQGNFATVMKDNATLAGALGTALVNLIGFFVALFAAASPLINRFADYIVKLTEAKAATLDTGDEIEAMSGRFDRAGDVMATIGDILSNIGAGIKAFGLDALPAGQGLLDSFKGASENFATLDERIGHAKVQQFFKDTGEITKELVGFLGDLLVSFIKISDAPEIKTMIGILRDQFIPVLDDTLEHGVTLGPLLADALVRVGKAFNALADTGALEAFINVITGLADIITKGLGDPVLGPLLTNLVLFEATLAGLSIARKFSGIDYLVNGLKGLGGVISPAKDGLTVFGGNLKKTGTIADAISKSLPKGLSSTFDDLYLKFLTLGDAGEKGIGKLGFLFKGLSGPAGAVVKILGPIGLIIGLIVGAIQGAADAGFFSEKWEELKGAVATLGPALEPLKAAFATILPVIKTVVSALGGKSDGTGLGGAIAFVVNIINLVLGRALNVVMGLFVNLVKIIGSVLRIFGGLLQIVFSVVRGIADLASAIIETVKAIFTGDFSKAGEAFKTLGKNLMDGLGKGLVNAGKGIFDLVKKLVFTIIDIFKDILGIASPSKVMADIGGFLVEGFINGIQGLVEGARAIIDGVVAVFKNIGTFVGDAFTALKDAVVNGIGIAVEFIKDHWDLISILLGPLVFVVTQVVKHWDEIKKTISDGVTAVMGFFAGIWDGITDGLQIAVDFIGEKWDQATGFVGDAIDFIKNLAINIFKGYIDAATAVYQWIFDKFELIKAAVQLAIDYIKIIGPAMFDVIKDAIQVAKDWIGTKFDETIAIISGIQQRVITAFGDAFKVVRDAISTVKQWIIDRIVDIITTFAGIRQRVITAFGDAFDIVRTKISEAKTWVENRFTDIITTVQGIGGRIRTALGDAFAVFREKVDTLKTNLEEKFTAIVTSLKGIWETLPDKLLTGLRGVRSKINELLIGKVNSVTTKFGLTIPEIPAFARGGYVRGAGGPKDDRILARLSNGEGVLNARTVKRIGGAAAIAALNSGRGIAAFAEGGVVGQVVQGASRIAGGVKGLAGNWVGTTLSGYTDVLAKSLKASDLFLVQFAGAIIDKLSEAVLKWGSDKDTGYGSMEGDEGSGRPTGSNTNTDLIQLGRWFQSLGARVSEHPAFGGVTAGAHVTGSDHYKPGGGAIDVNFGPGGENATEMAFFDKYASTVKGMGFKTLWRVAGHYNHLHAAFDRGGMANGLGFLAKATIKPERVLSPAQTQSFDRLVDYLTKQQGSGPSGVGGPRVVQYITNHYPVAEATSVTTNRSLQYAAALGDY